MRAPKRAPRSEAKYRVGDRLEYIGSWKLMKGVVGTVMKIYGGYRWFDDDEGEWCWAKFKYVVKVDKKPKGWPYRGTDLYSPPESDVTRIGD